MSSLVRQLWCIITFVVLLSISAEAQTHKGISFQGVIKLPSGEYPSRSGITVNAKILSPNDCVLREEQFAGISITNGYINIPIGTGTTGGANPAGLTLKNVMDNSSTFNSLTCLNADGSVNAGITSFDPSTTNGSRKFRLSLTIDSTSVVADFNMRSMAFAINAESLDGKTKTDFIQTSVTLTQARLEEFISNMTAASGNAIKWNGTNFIAYNPNDGSNITANSVTDTAISGLSYSKLTSVPAALTQISGLSCIDGKILKKISGAWACADEGGFSGVLAIANGGTGANTANSGFNALAPSQTGNSGKFLTTDGTNTSWAASSSQWNNGASSSINYTAGNVGIGTTAPGSRLDVQATSTITSGTQILLNSTLNYTPPSNPAMPTIIKGESNTLTASGAVSMANAGIKASDNTVNFTGGSTLLSAGGISSYAKNQSTGTITLASGGINSVSNEAGGAVTLATGGSNTVTNTGSGSINTAYGSSSSVTNSGTGNIAAAYGSSSSVTNSGTGNIAAAYGQYITVVASSGSITQSYGLFVDAIAGSSNAWGIYQNVGTNKNYFAGSVGIGSPNPVSKLDVGGGISVGTYSGVNPAPTNGLIVSGSVGIGTTSPDEHLVVFNGTTTGKYTSTGWTHSSDVRLKHDIKPLENSLEKIIQLRGVEYKFNSDPKNSTQIGFIAQEVEPIFPEVVQTDKDGFKSMVYANLVAPIIESIKNIFGDVQSLKAENAELKAELCKKDFTYSFCHK